MKPVLQIFDLVSDDAKGGQATLNYLKIHYEL